MPENIVEGTIILRIEKKSAPNFSWETKKKKKNEMMQLVIEKAKDC